MKAIRVQCPCGGDNGFLIAISRQLRPLAPGPKSNGADACAPAPLSSGDERCVRPYWRRMPYGMTSAASMSGICARAAVMGGMEWRGAVARHRLSKEREACAPVWAQSGA